MSPLPVPEEKDVEVAPIVGDDREFARHDNPVAIAAMAENIKANGLLNPLIVMAPLILLCGHFRLLAIRAAGIKTVRVRLYPPLTALQVAIVRASENLHRKELTAFQRYEIVTELAANQVGWTGKEVAAALNLDPSVVSSYIGLNRLIQPGLDAFKSGELALKQAAAISRMPVEKQSGFLAATLKGELSRDDLERAAKRPRTQPAVRAAAVTCRLSTGVTLVAKGKPLTLDELIECFADASREAKRAREQSLDIKTFQAVLRDRAKAN